MMGIWRLILLLFLMVAPLARAADSPLPQDKDVTVFAAASTTDVLNDLIGRYKAEAVRASFASSSALAKQIVNGAPADLFLSADREWMDFVASKKMLVEATRRDLLGNRLVLVAPLQSPLSLRVEPGFALGQALGDRRLAIGDPDHVPAGIYGKKALQSLGVWPTVENKLARTEDVRAALALVARGEVAAGIVYESDARISDRVKVIGVFSPDSHPPIAYPLAVIFGHDRPAVRRFYDYLFSSDAGAVFTKHGFRAMSKGQ